MVGSGQESSEHFYKSAQFKTNTLKEKKKIFYKNALSYFIKCLIYHAKQEKLSTVSISPLLNILNILY